VAARAEASADASMPSRCVPARQAGGSNGAAPSLVFVVFPGRSRHVLCAVLTHLTHAETRNVPLPLILFALAAVLAYLRRPERFRQST
jgi:hypothetical protein